jgi:ankyrin repeat protein
MRRLEALKTMKTIRLSTTAIHFHIADGFAASDQTVQQEKCTMRFNCNKKSRFAATVATIFFLTIHFSLSFLVERPHRVQHRQLPTSRLFAIITENVNMTVTLFPENTDTIKAHTKRIPFDQRTKGSRTARRMNSRFRFLYRHGTLDYHKTTAMEYLLQYYSKDQILQMNASFPPLLELNVSRHIHPKIRFLKETLNLNLNESESNTALMNNVPPHYFGARLEKIMAPRHAFLVHVGLPHGRALFENDSSKWHEFLSASRKTKLFCTLCNQWRREQQKQQPERKETPLITAKQIEAFDFLFGRGILAASRNELVQWNNTWPLEHINVTSAELIRLLIDHGANPLERDIRGTTILHWAAGTGNLEAVQELLGHFPNGLLETTERDGATPLHWAAAGANSKEFGTGGHVHVCHYLLSECTRQRRHYQGQDEGSAPPTAKDLVNKLTKDGNSPLMWAVWSASLDTVKLMIRHRAKWDLANQNGCTVAHWAASGGSLEVCQYLYEVVGVDFWEPNHGGNTPLTHSVAFGRVEIARWLREIASTRNQKEDDLIAAQLAEDFVRWDSEHSESDRQRRKKVLELFQDEYWDFDGDDSED